MSIPEQGGSDCAAVLARIATLVDAKSDSSLARALNVNRQTLASWRLRGTVPYTAAIRFAQERGLSLDYVLLGRGAPWAPYGDKAMTVMKGVVQELQASGVAPEVLPSWSALIFNRIASSSPASEDLGRRIQSEVEYVMHCLAPAPKSTRKR
jgi:hypothetical protein